MIRSRPHSAIAGAATIVVLAIGIGPDLTSKGRADDEARHLTAAEFKEARQTTNCVAVVSADPTGPMLDAEAAREAYACILPAMTEAFTASGLAAGVNYPDWARFTKHPYLSATHAGRFVSVYGNETARPYGRFEAMGSMPTGGIVVKDSFTVAASGRVSFGPLFVMEKLVPGANPTTNDWRYTMVMPAGWVFGQTAGVGGENVRFCAECHAAAAPGQDNLYFPPKAHRR